MGVLQGEGEVTVIHSNRHGASISLLPLTCNVAGCVFATPTSAVEGAGNLLDQPHRYCWAGLLGEGIRGRWSVSQKTGLQGLRVELTSGLGELPKGATLSSSCEGKTLGAAPAQDPPVTGATSPVLCFYLNLRLRTSQWPGMCLITLVAGLRMTACN